MSFLNCWGTFGLFGAAVMCCLAALSIFSVGLIVDKHRRFRSASRQSQTFKPVFGRFCTGRAPGADRMPCRSTRSPTWRRWSRRACSSTTACAAAEAIPSPSLELVTSALRDSMSETLIQLKRGLGLLATIWLDRPFVGLFGTVRRDHQRVPRHRRHRVRRDGGGLGRHRRGPGRDGPGHLRRHPGRRLLQSFHGQNRELPRRDESGFDPARELPLQGA